MKMTENKLRVLGLLVLGLAFLISVIPSREAKEVVTEMEEVIVAKLDTLVAATVYDPVLSQCDSDPLVTADLSVIDTTDCDLRWVALSRDLLEEYPYGTEIEILSPEIIAGTYQVRDCMNKRWKRRIDILRPNEDCGIPLGKWEDVVIRKKG